MYRYEKSSSAVSETMVSLLPVPLPLSAKTVLISWKVKFIFTLKIGLKVSILSLFSPHSYLMISNLASWI